MSNNDWIVLGVAALMLIHLGIGLPLFIVLGLGSLAMVAAVGVYSLSIVGEVPFTAVDNWALLAYRVLQRFFRTLDSYRKRGEVPLGGGGFGE